MTNNDHVNELILETMPIGLDIVDEKGTILFMNRFFLNIFGKKSIGRKCYKVYTDNKKQRNDCPLKSEISLDKTDTMTISGIAGDRTFKISYTGLIYNNKKAIMEMFIDMTDIKKVEKMLIDKSEELQKFNNMVVGRELKMIELKKKIEELEKKLLKK
jgi:two-component system, sensor histidine kinase and response regulator